MNFIANYWWLWSILTCLTFLYGGYNQISRMKRMMTVDDTLSNSFDAFIKGLVWLFLIAVLNLGFMVLLVTSIVLNIINYAR
jgi:hypothetical protein